MSRAQYLEIDLEELSKRYNDAPDDVRVEADKLIVAPSVALVVWFEAQVILPLLRCRYVSGSEGAFIGMSWTSWWPLGLVMYKLLLILVCSLTMCLSGSSAVLARAFVVVVSMSP